MDNLLDALTSIVNKYNNGNDTIKLKLLNELKAVTRFNNRQLVKYHDCLLYLLAYPDNEHIHTLARSELDRLVTMVSAFANARKLALSGTGLPFTTTICNYSFELSKWLSDEFGESISIDSSGADRTVMRETLRLFFPESEYWQTTQNTLSLESRIRLLWHKSNKSKQLAMLLKQIADTENTSLMQEYLFANLKLFVRWQLHIENSRSYLRALNAPVYYHNDLIRQISTTDVIEKPLSNPRLLSNEERLQLCYTAKCSLALLYRETDPITYVNPGEVVYFELERGISIALYGMNAERRFSIEAYIGYMAFKNGLPMAYGGGWMLGSRCKIGVNIYEPYRGGESAYVFSQIIRIYRQYYGMKRFVVKPYQFGKGNAEGIKSGAYWFYYKLGFRSVEKEIADIAKCEWDRITRNRGYRTPEKVLKQLTDCNLELVCKNDAMPIYDAGCISMAITAMINERHNGNRKKAIVHSMRYVRTSLSINGKKNNLQMLHFKQLALWFALIRNLDKWSLKDKNNLKELIELKSINNERKYILKLKAHIKLWNSMQYCLSMINS